MIQHSFSTSRKHLQHLVLAGLFLLGACSTQNQSDDESAAKTAKESVLNLKLAAGKTLYESNCAACHDSGSSGAPKLGNKEAWSGRMAEGKDVMIKKAITGIDGKIGMMPPRGGNTSLTDEDVKTVILYMTSKINTSEENTSVESPVL
ncbi:MAG: c-type cytochrome [Chlorobiaceae bacterium]